MRGLWCGGGRAYWSRVCGGVKSIRDPVVDKAGGIGAEAAPGTGVTVVSGNGPGADATCAVCSVDSGDVGGVATGA